MLFEKIKKPAPELERGTSRMAARRSTARQNPRFDPVGAGARTADRATTFFRPSKSTAVAPKRAPKKRPKLFEKWSQSELNTS